jgi:hypothetical protein
VRPSVRFAMRVYGGLLRLYPRRFRLEFEGEMAAVFEQAARQAAEQGKGALAALCLRELRDAPGAALAEHLREGRLMASLQPNDEDRPGSWRHAASAGLPHLLPILAASLPVFLTAWQPAVFQFMLPVFLAVAAFSLVAAWRSGWPRWWASWLGYGLVVATVYGEDRLLGGLRGDGNSALWSSLPYLSGEMLSEVIVACTFVALLYAIFHRDLVKGLLAALPAAYYAWVFYLEFVPPILSALVNVAAALVLALCAAAMVRHGRRAGGVGLIVAASALVGLLYSFGAVYLSSAAAFGSRTVGSVWSHFLPGFLGGAPLLLGPALGRRLWEHGRQGGPIGRAGFWLAGLGALLTLAGTLVVVTLWTRDGTQALIQPGIGWLWLATGLGALGYAIGAGLIARASWAAWTKRGRAAFGLLALLVLAAPWAAAAPRAWAQLVLPLRLPFGAGWAIPAGLLVGGAWLLLAAWQAGRTTRPAEAAAG